MNKLSPVLVILFIIIFVTGCSNSKPLPITHQEINQFIKEHHIKELDTEIIGEIAIVLFNTEHAVGYYMLYKDIDGVLKDKLVTGIPNISAPIYTFGSSSKYVFTGVIINDKTLLDLAHSIEIIYEDQTTIRKELFGSGIIITYGINIDKSISSSNVIIYDKNDKVIYSLN